MNEKIRHILGQITALEDELRESLHEQEDTFFYQIKDKRVEFERSVRDTHRQLKMGMFRWFLAVRPQNYLTAPVIYGMIVPLTLLDICVTIYQTTCFPIYGIAKARRSDYIVFDHRHLAYLNFFDKAHCLYCSYGNGLIAYALEITARTEQYFCPIKHARKILGTHSRYAKFLDYGEAGDYQAKREALRMALAKESVNVAVPPDDSKIPPHGCK
jgi:hypothetical protein